MQRDMDLVRSILLSIGAAEKPLVLKELLADDAEQADYDRLVYHLSMLIDQAGFVKGIPVHSFGGKNWLDLSLTWQGNEFLDSIRDPEIWKKTKAGAAKIGSSTIDVMVSVAKAIIQERMQKLISGGLE
jgi:hypothetical protein